MDSRINGKRLKREGLVKAMAEEVQNEKQAQIDFVKCRLKFIGLAQYGRAIHAVEGERYDLKLGGEGTAVRREHLEALKRREKNLEVME